MNLEARPWPVDFQATAAPRWFCFFFFVTRFGAFAFVLFVMFRAFFFAGCAAVISFFFLVLPAPPPTLCQARVRVFTPLPEAQDYRFFVFVQFRPADALLSSEPGGEQGTLLAHNVVQGYIRDCMLFFIYFCVVFVLIDSAIPSPPRGAAGGFIFTFHSGYLLFPHLTAATPMVRGNVWV